MCFRKSRNISIHQISSRWIFVAEPYMDTSLPKLVPSYSLSDKIPSTVLHPYRTIVRDTRLIFFKNAISEYFETLFRFSEILFLEGGEKEKEKLLKDS